MGTKRDRQNSILELVRQNRIESQQALATELGQRGYEVSQATLSRDIQELGLVKVGNAYVVAGGEVRRTSPQALRRILRDYLVDVDSVPPLLVLKTSTGNAGTVADAVDFAGWSRIVGTIAGDDTIFVLCRSADDVAAILARIEDLRS